MVRRRSAGASPAATAAATEPKRSVVTSRSRSAAAKRSIRSPASAHASPEAWSIITNTAQRPSSLQPSVASVAHSVSGTVTVIVPSCRRWARLRTLAVRASSPAPRVSCSTRLREVHTPRRRRRAHTLRWLSPTNGLVASTARISASSSESVIAPTGPERRRGGSEAPRRRRASHAAERDTPATRHTTSRVRAAARSLRAPRRLRGALLVQLCVAMRFSP